MAEYNQRSFEQMVNEAGERYRTGETGLLGLTGDIASSGVNSLFQWDRAQQKIAEDQAKLRSGEYGLPRHMYAQAGNLGESFGAPLEPIFNAVGNVLETDTEGPSFHKRLVLNPAFNLVEPVVSSGADAFMNLDVIKDDPELVEDTLNILNFADLWGFKKVAAVADPKIKGMAPSSFDVEVPAQYGATKDTVALGDNFQTFIDLSKIQYQRKQTGKPLLSIDELITELQDQQIKKEIPKTEISAGDLPRAYRSVLGAKKPKGKTAKALEYFGRPYKSAKGDQSKGEFHARTAAGFKDFFATGGSRAIRAFFSPEARARFAETGVSPSTYSQVTKFIKLEDELVRLRKVRDDLIKKAERKTGDRITPEELQQLDAAKTRLKELNKTVPKAAMAAQMQAQQNAHVFVQSGNMQDIASKSINDIAKLSSDKDILKLNNGKAYIDWNKGSDWYDVAYDALENKGRVKMEDIDIIQEHVENAWKIGKDGKETKIVFKDANSPFSGNHTADMFMNNSSLTGPALAFLRNFESTGSYSFNRSKDLLSALKQQQKIWNPKEGNWYPTNDASGKPIKYDWLGTRGIKKNFLIVQDAGDGGVWIQAANDKTGAKVEGGVNQLFKIGLDGHLIGVTSDKHDYLDNWIKPVSKFVGSRVPIDEVSVTRPIQSSIFKASTMNRRFPEAPNVPQGERKQGSGFRAESYQALKDLEASASGTGDLASQQRMNAEIARQRKLLQEGAAGGGMLLARPRNPSEQEQPVVDPNAMVNSDRNMLYQMDNPTAFRRY